MKQLWHSIGRILRLERGAQSIKLSDYDIASDVAYIIKSIERGTGLRDIDWLPILPDVLAAHLRNQDGKYDWDAVKRWSRWCVVSDISPEGFQCQTPV